MLEGFFIAFGAAIVGYAVGYRRGYRKGREFTTLRLNLNGLIKRDVQ